MYSYFNIIFYKRCAKDDTYMSLVRIKKRHPYMISSHKHYGWYEKFLNLGMIPCSRDFSEMDKIIVYNVIFRI